MRSKRAILIGAVLLVAGAAGMPIPSAAVPEGVRPRYVATPQAGLVGGLHDAAAIQDTPAVPEPTVAEAPIVIGTPIATEASAAEPAAESPSAEGSAVLATLTGAASYYANSLAGRRTASGERYDPAELIAAHRSYPFGTRLRVTNLRNDHSVEVRVIDRGPFVRGRVLDLSRAAAERLGFVRRGLTKVRIEVLEWGGGRN